MQRLPPIKWALRLGMAGLFAAASTGVAQELTDDFARPQAQQGQDLPTRTIPTDGETPRPQVSAVLTVDQERLLAESLWGKRAKQEIEDKGQKIEAENELLAKQLSDEEAELTKKRETLDPAEFRKLADAFDARATEVRRERARLVQELSVEAEEDRNTFYRNALPVMGEVMQSRGAVAVLDRRTVFVSLDAIDITDELIEALDARIGEGPMPKNMDDESGPEETAD